MTENTNKLPDRTKLSLVDRVKRFFQPSKFEVVLMCGLEPFYASLPVFAMTAEHGPKAFLYALLPQATTYAGARAYELLGDKNTLSYALLSNKLFPPEEFQPYNK